MSEQNYTKMLHALSREYYYNHIDFSVYREKRRIILDGIDADYNGVQADAQCSIEHDASLLSKAVSIFKSNDT